MRNFYKCPECGEETPLNNFAGKCPICGFTGKPSGFKLEGDGFGGSLAYKQLGILLLDGSGSMRMKTPELITKAQAVSKAVPEFFEMMKQSSISNHFCIAIVNFASKSQKLLDVTEISQLDTDANYNPIKEETGEETYLYMGLKESKKIIESFMKTKDDCKRSVVLVIMTDGLDMNEEEAKTTMRQLKDTYGEKLKVTASYFETMGLKDSDKKKIIDFLGEMVTDPNDCRTITSGEELRSFFLASVSKRR